jgi:hypothetical protein
MGVLCIFRSPGLSMNENRSADFISGGMSTIVMNIAAMKVKNGNT